LPPYKLQPHLRLLLADYVCTSIGLIITRYWHWFNIPLINER
jgi:hypothetical protein